MATRLHINAVLGMALQTVLTVMLIAALLVLVTQRIDVDESRDIIVGALLPIIGMSIKSMSDIAMKFANSAGE